jgi:retron-type reverse transcriptase
MNILREYIDDELLIDMLNQMFNASVLYSLNKKFEAPRNITRGVFQESLLSQTLLNIYLHKLDQYIIDKKSKL